MIQEFLIYKGWAPKSKAEAKKFGVTSFRPLGEF